MSVSDLSLAVELIHQHIKSQQEKLDAQKGEALSLLTFVRVHDALQAEKIPTKAALIVMFIYLHGYATHSLLNDFGIGRGKSNNNCSMCSYFKSIELMNDYLVSENSGNREHGKIFKLTKKGRTLGKKLTKLLMGE